MTMFFSSLQVASNFLKQSKQTTRSGSSIATWWWGLRYRHNTESSCSPSPTSVFYSPRSHWWVMMGLPSPRSLRPVRWIGPVLLCLPRQSTSDPTVSHTRSRADEALTAEPLSSERGMSATLRTLPQWKQLAKWSSAQTHWAESSTTANTYIFPCRTFFAKKASFSQSRSFYVYAYTF